MAAPEAKPLTDALRTSWNSTIESFRIAPGLTGAVWVTTLLLMAVPSLQVLLVLWAAGPKDNGAERAGTNLALTIILVTLGAVVMGAASSITNNLKSLLQLRLRAEYNSEFSEALAGLTPAQTIDSDLATQVRAVRDAIPFNVAWQASSTTTVVGAAIAMGLLTSSLWDINPLAAILIGIALIPELFTHSLLAKKENEIWKDQGRASRRSNYLEQIQDFQPANTELAANRGSFGIPQEARANYLEYARLWSIVPRKSIKLTALSAIAIAALAGGAFTLIITDPTTTQSALSAALLGLISGLSVTRDAGSAIGELMSSSPLILAHGRLLSLLRSNPPIPLVQGPLGISIKNLSFSYPSTAQQLNENADVASKATTPHALQDISLEIEPGSMIALVGPNGSGKTTLAKLISGVLEDHTGAISTYGKNIAEKHTKDSRVRLGATSLVFQDYTKFEVTVRQFVDPSSSHSDAEIIDSLKRSRSWEYIAQESEVLNAQLGTQWEGMGLSGGQWQRLVLARTFLSNAPIWVLDEPTAAIDAATENEIYRDVLKQRPPGTTVIVISHRPKTLINMDQIITLKQGHIRETGNYDQLLAADGEFANLVKNSLE